MYQRKESKKIGNWSIVNVEFCWDFSCKGKKGREEEMLRSSHCTLENVNYEKILWLSWNRNKENSSVGSEILSGCGEGSRGKLDKGIQAEGLKMRVRRAGKFLPLVTLKHTSFQNRGWKWVSGQALRRSLWGHQLWSGKSEQRIESSTVQPCTSAPLFIFSCMEEKRGQTSTGFCNWKPSNKCIDCWAP